MQSPSTTRIPFTSVTCLRPISNSTSVFDFLPRKCRYPDQWNRFAECVDAAHSALVKDPRSFKARYRRAMGRKGLKLFPECLIDLASVLTTDPAHVDATREFDIVEAICLQERRLMNTEEIVVADSPPAFGSEYRTPEQLPRLSEADVVVSPSLPTRTSSSGGHLERCFTCRVQKPRREIKTCKKVRHFRLTPV